MKSYFFLFCLLITGAGLSSAATVFTTSSSLGNSFGGYKGVAVTLANPHYTQSSTPTGDIKSETSVQLDSLTLTSQSNTSYYGGEVYMLVFETGSNFDSTVTSNLLGSSEVVNWSNNAAKDHTFSFSSGILLDPNKNYSFIFSSTADQYSALSGINNNARSLRLSMGGANAAGQGAYSATGAWAGNAIAKMNIKTSSVEAIPEPSTTTLGILGLASLMLRRRRK